MGLGILCLANAARALDPAKAISQYIHQRWGTDNGFPGGSVLAISQSADGYLWIGTERGLVRFDGADFTLIRQPIANAPPLGPVRGLVEDAEGNLWIRLDDARMLVYRDGKFEDAFGKFHLPPNVYTAMSDDGEGGVLLSGFGNLTLQLRKGEFEAIGQSNEVPGTVLALAEARDHNVWVGTRDGGLFRSSGGHFLSVSKELADAKINTLLPVNTGGLSSGGVWIGTDHGILFWDGTKLLNKGLPAAIDQLQILTLDRDREGSIWAGTDRGIVRITAEGAVSLDLLTKDASNPVTTIFQDRDGSFWFGGSHGIERIRDGMFATYSTAEGLPSEGNGPVFADSDGRAWFAPISGGLYWLNGGRIGRVTIAGLENDVVYSISGGNGEIWLGRQRGGLTVLTRNGESFAARTYTEADGLAQNSVFSVHRNRDGTVWAATVNAGVSVLSKGKFTTYTTKDGLASDAVKSIAEGYDGTMWFGTGSGLTSLSNGVWKNRFKSDGLPSADVKCVFEDSRHVLWIATSGGLAYLSSGHIAAAHNLPEPLREQIYGIAEDGLGSLWFATSDHVLQVNRDRLLTGSLDESDMQSYGVADGLEEVGGVSRDRSMVADSVGRIWIALLHGLAVADPRLTFASSVPVKVRVNSVSADGKQVNLMESPKLAPGSGTIIFNYAGTDLATSDRVRYRYKLDGADQKWGDAVALRQVIYKNLGPGTYKFRIVASNYEGLWNGPETDVPFVIEPQFWETWWFLAVCVSAFVLAVLLIYRLRTYQLTRQLNERFHERILERTRIAQELHDTLLQSFQGLMLRFQTIDEMLPSRPGDAKQALEVALDKADHALSESRDAIQDIRSSSIPVDDLERAMNALGTELRDELCTDQKDAPAFSVVVEGAPRRIHPIVRDELCRVARESLRNAFHHAHARHIETELTYDATLFRIRFRDDGKGIDPAIIERGARAGHWGLVGMHERAKRMGAKLDLWSKPGAGTEVELKLPSKIAYETPATLTGLRPFRRKVERDHD